MSAVLSLDVWGSAVRNGQVFLPHERSKAPESDGASDVDVCRSPVSDYEGISLPALNPHLGDVLH